MGKVTEWSNLTLTSFKAIGEEIMNTIPNIIGAILVLLMGWLITKLVIYLLQKTLKFIRIDKLTQKINELRLFGDSKIKFRVTKVITIFVRWILFLVFLIIASDIMSWEIVSKEIGNLLRYLPRLFSAIGLFMVGIYIANFVKKAIQGFYDSFDLAGSKIISTLAFYIIAIIITITALNQAGINTTVITNNVSAILGAFLLAIALGFGLGSKEIIGDLLRTFYAKKNYEVGDKIKIDDIEGIVESIDNICLKLSTVNGKIIIPIKDVIESRVEILKSIN